MRGNEIVVTAQPRGQFMEGILSGALKPGTICQIDPTVALVGGRHTYGVYNRDADGNMPKGAYWVLLANSLFGKTSTDAYADGDRAHFYSPQAGEELNLLVANLAGTGDDHTAGEILMVDDGTGLLIATTGTPESEVAVLKENITDPTADTLAWCEWTGH